MKKVKFLQFAVLFASSVFLLSWTPPATTIYGTWKLIPKESTTVTKWSSIDLVISQKGGKVKLTLIIRLESFGGLFGNERFVAHGLKSV